MSKMSELNADIRDLLCPDQLFPPTREDEYAALRMLCSFRKYKEIKPLPEQDSML